MAQINSDKALTDQHFRVRHPGQSPESVSANAHQPYRITLDDGRVIEGKSDADGLADLVKEDAMRILKINLFKPDL